jgi:hypothetical protein
MSVEASDPMVAIAPGMTRCEWCSCVYDVTGAIVDPRPSNWSAIPHKTCTICERVERMAQRHREPAFKQLPVSKPKPARPVTTRQKTVRRVGGGFDVLPPSDRD